MADLRSKLFVQTKMIKKLWKEIFEFFSDQENSEEARYDPAHFAAMMFSVLGLMTILFWLLWTFLIFEGGFFKKILPAFQVLFTGKTLQDFGWVGYPYELGIFSGFIGNTVALLLILALLVGIAWVLKQEER